MMAKDYKELYKQQLAKSLELEGVIKHFKNEINLNHRAEIKKLIDDSLTSAYNRCLNLYRQVDAEKEKAKKLRKTIKELKAKIRSNDGKV